MFDALTYLLLNSTLLISLCALLFFLLGLWLGQLLWAGHREAARRLGTELSTAQTDLAETREELTACRQRADAGEAALAEQRVAAESSAERPEEVDDLIADLRRQLDKAGSELEIARAEAMQLNGQLNEARNEAGRLRLDKERLESGQRRDKAAAAPPAARLSSAFAADLDAGNARVDDALGVLFDAPPEAADDLTKIKGIATVLNGKLNDFGVYTYRQIAAWDEDIVAAFSKRLSFRDRVVRDDWIGQAKRLHSQKYGEALD